MPVTIHPAAHGAESIFPSHRNRASKVVHSALDALPDGCEAECKAIIQSSIDTSTDKNVLLTSDNGFVYSLIDAYNSHHHLKIRPEDIWLAILTQLSAYVNKNAETLRGSFVSHQGQKELKLTYDNTSRHTFDYGIFAEDMSGLLAQNVVDPDLREWLIPDFSTTTRGDRVVASIVMMASLQKYFKYTCVTRCGLPSVTLLGIKADYEKILQKLEKLKMYGEEPTQFAGILRPVILRFIRCFDAPDSPETLDFWRLVVSRNTIRSGMNFYSGWITAFCYWDAKGNSKSLKPGRWNALELDGITYPTVPMGEVSPGWAKVPVKLVDNGVELESVMVAGSIGIKCDSSGTEIRKDLSHLDTMSAKFGWWIYEK